MADNHNEINEENASESADRGMPSIAKNKGAGGGITQKLVIAVIGIITILLLVAVNGGFSSEEEEGREASTSNTDVLNRLGPAPDLPPPPPPVQTRQERTESPTVVRTGQLAPPPPPRPSAASDESKEPTPADRKRQSSLLAFGNPSRSASGDSEASAQPVSNQGQSDLAEADTADGLAAKLKSTTIQGTRASILRDRSYFITQGTFLDCALETAISSAVPGMTSCRLTRDVYSTDRKVLLLERGSRIVGQYQGGLQRGQARIFVLWSRVETPNGVIVELDSPGTDSLGRSGLEGFVDTHFWERFGGAIMLSLVDDVGTYVANEASGSGSGGNQIQFGGTADSAQNAASIALENSINIPPTLLKNQGDHINIFVARDLDFRGVYDLKVNN